MEPAWPGASLRRRCWIHRRQDREARIDSGDADPACVLILGGPAVGGVYYGADPNHARRTPGLVYENPPFSAQVDAENQARFTATQTHTPTLPYVNQPPYNVSKTQTRGVANAISVGEGDPSTAGDGFTDIYN